MSRRYWKLLLHTGSLLAAISTAIGASVAVAATLLFAEEPDATVLMSLKMFAGTLFLYGANLLYAAVILLLPAFAVLVALAKSGLLTKRIHVSCALGAVIFAAGFWFALGRNVVPSMEACLVLLGLAGGILCTRRTHRWWTEDQQARAAL